MNNTKLGDLYFLGERGRTGLSPFTFSLVPAGGRQRPCCREGVQSWSPVPEDYHDSVPRPVVRMALIAGVLALVAASCNEQDTRRYNSLADALAAGERDRGWLPTCFPASATDILLTTRADSNEVWMTFAFASADEAPFKACLVPTSVAHQRVRSAAQWPSILTGDLDANAVTASRLETYRTDGAYVAVNWHERRGYLWSLGS